ncbi:serine/threonine-protein kinase [Nocardioides sp. MAHUQ-72]|uniref:serine/threonine-protein kinase n=1 Tax=unclassified Nocardioides TaxID=2615069 RepID=UPI00361DB27A
MTTAPRPDLPVSRTVGDYTLLARIGEGGMGVVHLARRPGGERVALKVLRPHIVGDDEARQRLAREVSSLSRIRSRWVAEIVDADPWAEVPYVATRYVPGLSLHDHVVDEGPITGGDLTWFAGCLAEGLASVHAVGVLHRDVKPSNVLMEGRTPILIDFGLARVADDPKLTHTGWLLGTPGYLAPEILYGDDATTASDVHSWAATVAYAGTGRPPFGRGPSMAIMDRVRRGEHDLDGLPAELRGIVGAALDPDPARRPTVEDLLRWLRPDATRVPPAAAPAEDPYTVPLALAAQSAADDPTDQLRHETLVDGPEPTTRIFPDEGPAWSDRQHEGWSDDAQPWPAAAPPVPWPERLRRGLLLGGFALAAGGAVAAFPWPATALLVALTWLLRSGSLAASAAGDRRRLRGRKWYDGVQFLVAAPWHLVRSIAGSVLLALWSLGLAVAAALICYAVAASVSTTLAASGAVFAASLWLGPGGSRVRSPLGRLVNPASASPQAWIGAVLVVLALTLLLAIRVDTAGTSWVPFRDQPFAGLTIPDGLPLG